MSALLTTDELKAWFEVAQAAKLRRLLLARDIPFTLNGIGEPITTLDAINDSLKNKQPEQEIDF